MCRIFAEDDAKSREIYVNGRNGKSDERRGGMQLNLKCVSS